MEDKKYLTHAEFNQTAKDILRDFKYFCEKNNLRYFLAYGTLLGAVRHKDIIPWDYDIDVHMPRKDFEKFVVLSTETPINSHLKTFSWLNYKTYYLPFAKVCDTRTRLVITQTKGKIPLGVWIDIFPLDGFSDNEEERNREKDKFDSTCHQAGLLALPNISIKEKIWNFKKYVPVAILKEAHFIEKANRFASKHDFDNSNYVCSTFPKKIWYKKDFFDSNVMINFGEEKFSCPGKYDEILKLHYGDYMELPPEEKRELPTFKTYYVD